MAGYIFKIILILFITNYFDYLMASSYEWNSTNLADNVRVFPNFLMDVHKNYEYNENLLLNNELIFYCSFVKYAAQLANDCIVHADDQFLSANDVTFSIDQFETNNLYGLNSDSALQNAIAEAFNANILNAEHPIPKAVLHQILQLTFSFAARIYISFNDYKLFNFKMHDWKMETLLDAYKHLNAIHDTNNAHGIFPFRFIVFDPLFRLTEIYLENIETEDYSLEQMRYIENFKFVLTLSEHSLTIYEVYKTLFIIKKEFKSNFKYNLPKNGPPPAVYTFIKKFFNEKIGEKALMDADFSRLVVEFGNQLYYRVIYKRDEPNVDDYDSKWISFMKKRGNRSDNVNALLESVFNEALLHYVLAIRIEYDQCIEILQIVNDSKSLLFELTSETGNHESISELMYEFLEYLLDILLELEDMENVEKLDNSVTDFEEKNPKELLKILNKTADEYSSSPYCKWDLNESARNIPKFGQILFQTINGVSEEVKYDGNAQLLSFPLAIGEHFLDRLHTLMEEKKSSICKIGEELDFVKTIQNIVSTGKLEFLPRTKGIPTRVNTQLFKLFLSLAIRLSVQFENDDLARKYLNTFISANECITVPEQIKKDHSFLKTQITKLDERIEAKIPNWKINNLLFLQNIEHLEIENVKRNFEFLFALSEHSTTIYDVLKIVKILGEMNDEQQIWVSPSDPKIFLFFLNYLTGIEEPREKIQISIENKICLLTYFVEDLLEDMAAENENCLEDDFIGVLIGKLSLLKQKLCEQKSKKGEIFKYFKENLLQYARAIKVNSNIREDLHQITDVLIEKVKKMLKNREWNYAKLKYEKRLEWTLLKIVFDKNGQKDQWEEIKKLCGEWETAFNEGYFVGNETSKSAEFMEKLLEQLEIFGKM